MLARWYPVLLALNEVLWRIFSLAAGYSLVSVRNCTYISRCTYCPSSFYPRLLIPHSAFDCPVPGSSQKVMDVCVCLFPLFGLSDEVSCARCRTNTVTCRRRGFGRRIGRKHAKRANSNFYPPGVREPKRIGKIILHARGGWRRVIKLTDSLGLCLSCGALQLRGWLDYNTNIPRCMALG